MRTEDRIQETGFRIQNSEGPKHTSTPNFISLASGSCLLAPGSCRSRRAAFTLIEIMVVMVIIMILMGIVIGTAKYAQTKAARSRTQAEIAAMENALESYKNDNGAYPPSTTTRDSGSGNAPGLIAINNCVKLYTALAGGSKVYMTFKPGQLGKDSGGNPYIIDPFGNPYNYYYQVSPNPLPVNQATFDLWSCGPGATNEPPNSISGNITNWKQ